MLRASISFLKQIIKWNLNLVNSKKGIQAKTEGQSGLTDGSPVMVNARARKTGQQPFEAAHLASSRGWDRGSHLQMSSILQGAKLWGQACNPVI